MKKKANSQPAEKPCRVFRQPLQKRRRQPYKAHEPAAQNGGNDRGQAVAFRGRQALGTGVALGDAHRLVHKLPGRNAVLPQHIVAQNKDRLIENAGVGRLHNNNPPGNTLDQNLSPPSMWIG